MYLNLKISACIRIGPRFHVNNTVILLHTANSFGLTLYDTL